MKREKLKIPRAHTDDSVVNAVLRSETFRLAGLARGSTTERKTSSATGAALAAADDCNRAFSCLSCAGGNVRRAEEHRGKLHWTKDAFAISFTEKLLVQPVAKRMQQCHPIFEKLHKAHSSRLYRGRSFASQY